MSKRDYYEVLEVTRTRDRAGNQERVPQARAEAPSGSQSGRQGRGREVQGSRRGVCGPGRCEKRSLYDRFGHAGVSGGGSSGGFDPSVFAGFEDILGGLGDIFGFGDLFGGGRRRGGPQRGADLRYDLEISFEESAQGTETSIQFPAPRAASRATARAPRRDRGPTTCPTCHGRGQLRYQQGFFTVARTCSQCRGTGQIIAKPCDDLPRRRAA